MNEIPSAEADPLDPRPDDDSERPAGVLHRLSRRIERALVWNNIFRAKSYMRSAI